MQSRCSMLCTSSFPVSPPGITFIPKPAVDDDFAAVLISYFMSMQKMITICMFNEVLTSTNITKIINYITAICLLLCVHEYTLIDLFNLITIYCDSSCTSVNRDVWLTSYLITLSLQFNIQGDFNYNALNY
jgi:hypothetical protein